VACVTGFRDIDLENISSGSSFKQVPEFTFYIRVVAFLSFRFQEPTCHFRCVPSRTRMMACFTVTVGYLNAGDDMKIILHLHKKIV